MPKLIIILLSLLILNTLGAKNHSPLKSKKIQRGGGNIVGDGDTYYIFKDNSTSLADFVETFNSGHPHDPKTQLLALPDYPKIYSELTRLKNIIKTRTYNPSSSHQYNILSTYSKFLFYVANDYHCKGHQEKYHEKLLPFLIDSRSCIIELYSKKNGGETTSPHIIELNQTEFNSESSTKIALSIIYEMLHDSLINHNKGKDYPDIDMIINPFIQNLNIIQKEHQKQTNLFLNEKVLPTVSKTVTQASERFQEALFRIVELKTDTKIELKFKVNPRGGGIVAYEGDKKNYKYLENMSSNYIGISSAIKIFPLNDNMQDNTFLNSSLNFSHKTKRYTPITLTNTTIKDSTIHADTTINLSESFIDNSEIKVLYIGESPIFNCNNCTIITSKIVLSNVTGEGIDIIDSKLTFAEINNVSLIDSTLRALTFDNSEHPTVTFKNSNLSLHASEFLPIINNSNSLLTIENLNLELTDRYLEDAITIDSEVTNPLTFIPTNKYYVTSGKKDSLFYYYYNIVLKDIEQFNKEYRDYGNIILRKEEENE